MTQSNSNLSNTRVSEWKSNVQSFFNEDWPKLRALIMELEETKWSVATDDTQPLSGTKSQVETLTHLPLASYKGNDSTPQLHGTESPGSERLSELARQIELRLQSSTEQGREPREYA